MSFKFGKTTLLALSTLAATLGAAGPALADGTKDMIKNSAMLPVRMLSVGSTAVVGTPIAITRQVTVRIRQFTKEGADKIGGSKDFPPNFYASFFSVPAGTLVGTAEGFYYGGKNAVQAGYKKPFSLEAFSLGDEIDSDSK